LKNPIFPSIKIFSMKKLLRSFWLGMSLLSALPAFAQSPRDTVTLTGVVKDFDNFPLPNATVQIENTQIGATTDLNGFFLLRLAAGNYVLQISYLGYDAKRVELTLNKNTTQTINLEQSLNQLEEIVVRERAADYNLSSTDIGVTQLSIQSIRKLPSLLGEVDVIRSILLLPGVTTVGEGAGGFNVRGGNTDQNLVLMDGVPLFNTSHLLGLFSVFNPDAVQKVTFYRGGIPAQYGGRSSSVLDIALKDPDDEKLHVNGGIGILASRLLIDAPIVKNKLSVYAAGRISYADYLFDFLPDEDLKRTKANFYDLVGKLKYQLNDRNQVQFMGYFSKDVFRLAGNTSPTVGVSANSTLFKWQTALYSLRWTHFFNERFFMNVLVANSDYQPGYEINEATNASELKSSVLYQNAKIDLQQSFDKHQFNYGVSAIRYQIFPADLQPTTSESAINPLTLPEEQAIEAAAYWGDDWKINAALSLSYGLRYSYFANVGPTKVYDYNPERPRDDNSVTGATDYSDGKIVKTYQGAEPRVALNWRLNPQSSVKIGYNRMRQYIQLISNTTAALPIDRWKLSDTYIEPQVTDQLSLGYFRNFKNNAFETSIELYYKKIDNLLDYRSGVNFLLLEKMETGLLQGEGRSYGLELLVRENQGKLTGWATYTYSNAQILVNSPYPEDGVFSGRYYPTNFNRPHVFNLVLNYQQSRQVSFSLNFTYNSGRPVTYAQDKFYVGNVYVPSFVNRNEDQIPDYHRLDLGATIEPKRKLNQRWESRWMFSIYNAYFRKNPYSVFFQTQNNNNIQVSNKVNAYRLSVIGTMVPSVTYEFKF